MTKQCGWCKRWLIGEKWMPMMKKYWPPETETTQGMCPDCFDELCVLGTKVS